MLAFQKVSDFTTFDAEFAMERGDIVFHFFKTKEILSLSKADQDRYWDETFPRVLEPVALSFFKVTADSGRLKAEHVYDPELETEGHPLDSWWFRAFGFGHRLDPHALALKFLDNLDSGLEAALVGAAPAGSATKRI